MNSRLLFPLALCCALPGLEAASLPPAVAVSVSETFVGSTRAIEGSRKGGGRLNFLSPQCVCPVVYAGRVTSVAGGQLTDAGASWAEDAFNGTNGSFYVEFDSGMMADILDTFASNSTLQVVGDVASIASAGDVFRVRRHLTVADYFGETNRAGLLAGTNSVDADNILIPVPESQETLTIFYCNEPGWEGWRFEDRTPAGDTVIFPERGMIVRRLGKTKLMVPQHGAVKSQPSLVPISPGYNLVGTLRARGNLRLVELNLYTGDPSTGLAAGIDAVTADNIQVVNPAKSQTRTYFYSSAPGREGWFDDAWKPASKVVIPAGHPFYVVRKAPRAAFYWSVPTN